MQIYESGKKIDNSKTYTHSIKKLIKYGEELGLQLNIPKSIIENAQMITDWEAGSRYGLGLSIRIDVLEKYYKMVDEWAKGKQKA